VNAKLVKQEKQRNMNALANNQYTGYLGWCIAILAFSILVSLPILQSGFFGDDIWDSTLQGTLSLNHQSFWQIISAFTKSWLVEGRFFPLNVFSTTALFYAVSDLSTYQSVRLVFIWLSLLAFAWLVKLISNNLAAGCLLLFLVPMCWSVKVAPDALTSYAIFMPLLAIFIAVALAAFIKFQQTHQQGWIDLSFFMYLSALLTYELGIITFFLLLLFVKYGPYADKKFLRSLWPFGALTLVYGLMNLRLHLNNANVYSGIKIGSLTKFFPAFLAQLSAAFPLTSYLFLPSSTKIFSFSSNFTHFQFSFLISGLALITCICVYRLILKIGLTRSTIQCFILLGMSLMVLPAALIGINGHYQNTVILGKGYIPVYIQYFGLAIIILALLGLFNKTRLQQTLKRTLQACIAICISVIMVLGVLLNFNMINTMNIIAQKNYRILVENALHHDLLANLPPHATIIEKYEIWNTKAFYIMHGDKQIDEIIFSNGFQKLPDGSAIKNVFLIDGFHLANQSDGYVLIGQFKNLHQIANPLVYITASNPENLDRIIKSLQLKLALTNQYLQTITANFDKSSPQHEFIFHLPENEYTLANTN
jgi:hypothetical protein